MGPLLGLLLLVAAASCADNATSTVAPATTVAPNTTVASASIAKEEPRGCALYCFILPQRSERVNFTLYSNLTSCTHFVYGMGEISTGMQYKGPSTQDAATHSYPGNFYYLRKLRAGNPLSSLLLGVHLKTRDSLISYPPSRQQLATSLLRSAHDLHVDGLFLLADHPFIDNSRFPHFLKDIISHNKSLPVVLGVPLPQVSHSLTPILESHHLVQAVYLMSTPSLTRIAQVDPLLPTSATPPEQTISYHVEELAAHGIPKKKIVVGLTTGAVVYKNYLIDSIREEAEGSLAPLQETCMALGEKALDSSAASEMTKVKASHTYFASNAPIDGAVGRKARWLSSAGYGGIGLQSMQHDDPLGECNIAGVESRPFPTLRMVADNWECEKPTKQPKSCTRLCYVNSRSPLSKLKPSSCSHVVVEATLTIVGEVKLTADAEATAKWIRHWHVAQRPKLMISLGPQQTSDVWRIALVAPYSRKAVIKQLQDLLTEWKGVGVELSWTLGPLDFPTDATNLESLLNEMREAYGKNTTLAVAVTHTATYDNRYAFMKSLNETVDYLVLHSHRFHSSRQPFTGHHSPLFYSSEILPDHKLTVEGLVSYWNAHFHMPRSKIVVGITAEPMSMMLMGQDRADQSPFNMVANPSVNNPLLRSSDETTAMNGKRVCELAKDETSRVTFIDSLAVPFLVNGHQFVAYEDERSVQMKTTWTSLNHLGGIALFNVQLDNPEGECPMHRPFPLLEAIAKAQVCETCVNTEAVSPCDTMFTTSCSYRLPTAADKSPMPTKKIPFESCSQIVIEEVLLKADGSIEFRDETAREAMEKLGHQGPRVGQKRMIASVQCKMGQEEFRGIIANEGPSTVRSLLSFITKYSLSGIELRCDHLIDSPDKDAFSSFIHGLRTALVESTPLEKCPHSLSLRLPVSTSSLSKTYDIAVLNSVKHVVLEPFNDPPKDNMTHLNSPLFAANGHENAIDTTIGAWIAEGLEKERILLQIPAYATLQDFSSNVSEIGVAASHPRMIGEAEVCSLVKTSEKRMLWDRIATYAVTSQREWMSMQTQETIAYKIFYAIREGLGGVGLLSLNEDDWNGDCGSGEFPLLTAAKARCLAQKH